MPHETALIALGENWIRADAIVAVSSVFADVDNGRWMFLVLLRGGHEISVGAEEGIEDPEKDVWTKRGIFLSEWRKKVDLTNPAQTAS